MAKDQKRTDQKRTFNEQNYERLAITIPKGAKRKLEKAAQKEGTSVNGYVNDAIAAKMGVETLKSFSVAVTKRKVIYTVNEAGKEIPMSDEELRYHDGIKREVVIVKANSKAEANQIASEHASKTQDDGFNPDSITYDAQEQNGNK